MKVGIVKMIGRGEVLAQVPLRSHSLYFFTLLKKSDDATRIDLYVDGAFRKRYPITCIQTKDERLFATQDMMWEFE